MPLFFPNLFLSDVDLLLLETFERAVFGSNVTDVILSIVEAGINIEGMVVCVIETEGIWVDVIVDGFLLLLQPFPFVLLWRKASPLGRSFEPHLLSPLGNFLFGLTGGISVTSCPSAVDMLCVFSPELLAVTDEL